jgi:potassium-transporting ATPase KdpC subunit
MKNLIRPAVMLLLLTTLCTGLLYPLAVTCLAQLLYPANANGNFITQNGKVIGSRLIGQAFTDRRYFWGRPSATTPMPYNAANSGGSNWGPTNPAFIATVKQRVLRLQEPTQATVPMDLVTSSASGLDPEISPAGAYYQAARVAQARHMPIANVNALIARAIVTPQWDLLGEARVNVLELNLALDGS